MHTVYLYSCCIYIWCVFTSVMLFWAAWSSSPLTSSCCWREATSPSSFSLTSPSSLSFSFSSPERLWSWPFTTSSCFWASSWTLCRLSFSSFSCSDDLVLDWGDRQKHNELYQVFGGVHLTVLEVWHNTSILSLSLMITLFLSLLLPPSLPLSSLSHFSLSLFSLSYLL